LVELVESAVESVFYQVEVGQDVNTLRRTDLCPSWNAQGRHGVSAGATKLSCVDTDRELLKIPRWNGSTDGTTKRLCPNVKVLDRSGDCTRMDKG